MENTFVNSQYVWKIKLFNFRIKVNNNTIEKGLEVKYFRFRSEDVSLQPYSIPREGANVQMRQSREEDCSWAVCDSSYACQQQTRFFEKISNI